MKITFDSQSPDEAKRMAHLDDAFSLIWDIDQELRKEGKYPTEKTKDDLIDDIRQMISESNLLELWL